MEEEIISIKAYHVQYPLSIRQLKPLLGEELIEAGSTELFFSLGKDKYGLIFNYGVLVFYNCTQVDISQIFVRLDLEGLVEEIDYYDDYGVKLSKGDLKINFHYVTLPEITEAVIHISMLNLGQSLALKYFDDVSQELLSKIRIFTGALENNGKLKIGRNKLLKFVGKALNTQNKIAENLYIFDAPPATWESEYLEKVNTSLARHFELGSRYRSVENTLTIIRDNLSTYMELYHHSESSRLEWIIIILILVEVIDTFVSKLF